ncbi:DUF3842 family protein [Abyssisolibacter fermentans]|uniref:DUF3842 family protein n=1 Tax=Abyssisolibacter fermentans TaxID=1766203 RepID=UPI00082ACF83|nr:DUF3842 family protein [Abyssisolibacter fermentans]
MIVAVIDGMGGGIGSKIVSALRDELPSYVEIYALGTNSAATSAMMKSRANKGATGENAVAVSIRNASVIIGPVSIMMPNAMMGEITPRIAESIMLADGLKILLPIMQENYEIVGLENKPILLLIKDAVERIKKEFNL